MYSSQIIPCQVCLFVCLFNRLLRAEKHLGPDGTRLKQNAQARLKSLYKHAGQLVYENVKKLRNRFELKIRDEGKEDHGHSHFGTRERRFFIQSQRPLRLVIRMKCLISSSAVSTFNGLFQGIQLSKDFFFLYQYLTFPV